jgi:predicted nuclease of predicted toxin-antitoxin system
LIRLLLDQGLPRSAAKFLGDAGWDVLHVGAIGMARSSDAEILDYARREQRVCVTLDADFHSRLAVSGASRPLTIRIWIEVLDGRALAELLKRVWPAIAVALDQGAMATITDRSIRLRRLPIARSEVR